MNNDDDECKMSISPEVTSVMGNCVKLLIFHDFISVIKNSARLFQTKDQNSCLEFIQKCSADWNYANDFCIQDEEKFVSTMCEFVQQYIAIIDDNCGHACELIKWKDFMGYHGLTKPRVAKRLMFENDMYIEH